ncbi:MAG: SUMF1/EgtB/PvdO family nonheme iron enzyme [Blastocatellia bacterium]
MPTPCSSCQTPVADEMRFCQQCGHSVDAPLAVDLAPALYCVRCGVAEIAGNAFCQNCGSRRQDDQDDKDQDIQGFCRHCRASWSGAWLCCRHCGKTWNEALEALRYNDAGASAGKPGGQPAATASATGTSSGEFPHDNPGACPACGFAVQEGVENCEVCGEDVSAGPPRIRIIRRAENEIDTIVSVLPVPANAPRAAVIEAATQTEPTPAAKSYDDFADPALAIFTQWDPGEESSMLARADARQVNGDYQHLVPFESALETPAPAIPENVVMMATDAGEDVLALDPVADTDEQNAWLDPAIRRTLEIERVRRTASVRAVTQAEPAHAAGEKAAPANGHANGAANMNGADMPAPPVIDPTPATVDFAPPAPPAPPVYIAGHHAPDTNGRLHMSINMPPPVISPPALPDDDFPGLPASAALWQKPAFRVGIYVVGLLLSLVPLFWLVTSLSGKTAGTGATPAPPAGMVYVPGGVYQMGRADGDQYESPPHQVTVGPFFMDQTEITNQQYQEFINQTGHPAPAHWTGGRIPEGQERWPVVHVSWNDALRYAQWAGKQLPTEEQWEFAARGRDGRLYPWGMTWQSGAANVRETAQDQPVEAGLIRAGVSPFGLYDMSGNVWEWTASEPFSYSSGKLLFPDNRVIRGGAFNAQRDRATTTYRSFLNPGKGYPRVGFRCVREIRK